MNTFATSATAMLTALGPMVTVIVVYLLWRQDLRRMEEKMEKRLETTDRKIEDL